MEVPFSGTLDYRSLRRAISGHSIIARVFAVVLIAITVFALGTLLFIPQPSRVLPQLPGLLFPGLLGAFFWLQPVLTARRLLKTSKLLRAPLSGVATKEGLQLASAYGTSNLPWNVFHRARPLPDSVLLYQSAVGFYVLPRSFFATDTDWAQFVSWARTHVPKPPSTFLRSLLIWFALLGFILLLFHFVDRA